MHLNLGLEGNRKTQDGQRLESLNNMIASPFKKDKDAHRTLQLQEGAKYGGVP